MTAPLLQNRVALVTGASRGLGLAIAGHFLAAGARLVVCARTQASIDAGAASLRTAHGAQAPLLAVAADVSKPPDVARLIAQAVDRFGGIDVLVNNAGVQGPLGPLETVDGQAWARAVEVNLLGSVLLAQAVLPRMKRQGWGKIIQLSGGGATRPMAGMSAYAASKAAVVRFVETLALEVSGTGIDVNALAPGALNTDMLDEVLAAGPAKVGEARHADALRQKATGGASLQEAAALAVFLASAQSDGISGRLISAVWDHWRQLPAHKAELEGSDVYTLRRITALERGFDWGDR
jgi:NAD(P)-dependent dehydrogenase (short-subunit alcohol dehydrogenase family)